MGNFKCRGCELASDGGFLADGVVHERECILFEPQKTFEDKVIEAIVQDIKKTGRIAEALRQCA